MKLRLLSFCLLPIAYCILLTGCQMPNGGIPIYMRMDSATVVTGIGQGAPSDNITDVWVEANTDTVGAFGLPCNIPVLQQNDVRFVVSTGIKESGQSGVRVIYPFYTTDTFSIVGVPGTQYTHQPVFKYVPGAVFSFAEDFNFSNPFTGSTVVNDSGYNGSRCIKFSVDATDSSKEISHVTKYDLPEGQEIWLEVDYKCEVPFYIGFYGTFNASGVVRAPVMLVTAQPEWHKVYVKFSNYVGQLRADTYNIYFEALRPYGSTGGTVYIDNVKLVHF